MLRVLALLVALVIGTVGPAAAANGDDKAAIRNVIESQLDAFQRDDAREAFSYASPTIQEKFGTPTRFMSMVRSGYQAVYRPRAVEFRGLSERRGRLAQRVFFVGPDGRAVIAIYFMEQQDDGTWRIDGVQMTEAPDEAV
jgi:hypothetical protein